jgi:hypothetical protein
MSPNNKYSYQYSSSSIFDSTQFQNEDREGDSKRNKKNTNGHIPLYRNGDAI